MHDAARALAAQFAPSKIFSSYCVRLKITECIFCSLRWKDCKSDSANATLFSASAPKSVLFMQRMQSTGHENIQTRVQESDWKASSMRLDSLFASLRLYRTVDYLPSRSLASRMSNPCSLEPFFVSPPPPPFRPVRAFPPKNIKKNSARSALQGESKLARGDDDAASSSSLGEAQA